MKAPETVVTQGKLKPCPFCGALPGYGHPSGEFGDVFFHPGAITDDDCVLSGKGFYSKELAAWNTREQGRPPPLQSGEIGEMVECVPDTWQKDGYTSPVAEIADMANIGRSFMERYSEFVKEGGQYAAWMPLDDPTEFVTHLADEADAANAHADELEDARDALQAELASARKAVEGLNAHIEAMQGMCASYITPEPYQGFTPGNEQMFVGAAAHDRETFIRDMIYMLDGPEQRDVQTPARDWLAGATP